MAHPYHHAESSARKYGGSPGEYLDLHEWFDASKQYMADNERPLSRVLPSAGFKMCAGTA